MLKIVTWLWGGDSSRSKDKIVFTANHVNIMKRMVSRNLSLPHEFVCITDNPKGIDKDIRAVEIWDNFRDFGGCYVRLKLFSNEMKEIIGDRFVSIDLDAVIVNDITPLFDRTEDFIIWGEHYRFSPYCCSLFMMNAGSRSHVWRSFSNDDYWFVKDNRLRRLYGTDQYYVNKCLYPYEKTWDVYDGVYNFNLHIRKWRGAKINRVFPSMFHDILYSSILGKNIGDRYVKKGGKADGKLPEDARIVFFNGKVDPSEFSNNNEYPWIKEHWC